MYKYPELKKGRFIKRYKRFFTDIDYNGELITAHNPNTGSMTGLLGEGREVLFSESDNPKRKLKYTLEAIKVGSEWILTNTMHTNHYVYNAVKDGEISCFGNVNYIKKEFKYKDGRLDLYMETEKGKAVGEIKSVTLFDDKVNMFPDAVTTRGLKHLNILREAVLEGYDAYNIFVVKADRKEFRCAEHVDPEYCKMLDQVRKEGVKIVVLKCDFDAESGVVTLRELI